MLNRSFASEYRKAAEEAFHNHLAGLGFEIKKQRSMAIVAESECCRVVLDPNYVMPIIQRISADLKAPDSAYDLSLLLEALDPDSDFTAQPISDPMTMHAEVDRIVGLLVEKCRLILDDDEAAWQRVHELSTKKENEAIARMGDAGLRLKEDDKWRELPELESVRVKGPNKLATILIAVLLLIIPVIAALSFLIMFVHTLFHLSNHDSPAMLSVSLVLGIVSALLDIWIAKRVFRGQYYLETSESGLAIGRLFGRQFILWSDIDYAVRNPSVGYEIQTSKGTVKLDKQTLTDIYLEASIWQHLNRLGKADALPLSQFAMSLWAQIPDEKVEDLYWENPKPPRADEILLYFVLWQVLIWGIFLRTKLHYWSPPVIVSTWQITSMCRSLTTIKHVAVSSDHIEAVTAITRLNSQWDSVRSVKFVGGAPKQPACLQLRVGAFNFIRIPWIPEHPNSTRVILAIIRRLRHEERFKLLPFPAVLLMAAHDGVIQEDFLQ